MKFVFALSWTATFIQLMLRLSWGVIAVVFSYLLHLNSVEIGAVLSLFYVGYISSSIFWGIYIDYLGPKKIIFISALLSGLTLISVLFITNVIQLYVIYLLEGVFTAGLFPSSIKIVSSIGNQVTSYIALLESAAPIVLLILAIISSLILTFWTYFYIAVIIILLSTSFLSLNLKINHTPNKGFRKIILNKKMIKASIIRAGELWGTWGTSSWLFPFLVLYDGIGKIDAEILFFFYALGQFISIILASKSKNESYAVKISLILFIISAVIVAFSKTLYLLIPISVILGISSFLYRPTTDSLIVKLMGNENAGKSMGFANAVSQIGSLLAPLFVGGLIYLGFPSLAIIGLALGPIISLILINMM
ncbi:MFS transporter [Acidianus manzaensis]|uniref:MFS transporter n=1 Tax=Acidianus manzaensis TaxID=282676 RepID=A0A1W6JYA7_9CREN|nr:MFS transporter [Acidianus manzaensis]ARM75248.1 MFS transporter [Acidianus manzaensis]